LKEITNTQIIESRSKWAKRIAPLTMLFLIGGLITNFLSINQPQYFQPTLVLLALGFVFATISSYLTNRWVREPRADQILTSMLKKFNNEYVLFNYTVSPPHILLTPSRLYVIVVKQQDGKITVKGNRISRDFSWKLFFRYFADENMGSPVAEVENGVGKLRKLLGNHLADEEMPEIEPLLLFSNKKAELNITDPAVPIVRSNEFKGYLREESKIKNISGSQRDKIAEVLGAGWDEN